MTNLISQKARESCEKIIKKHKGAQAAECLSDVILLCECLAAAADDEQARDALQGVSIGREYLAKVLRSQMS